MDFRQQLPSTSCSEHCLLSLLGVAVGCWGLGDRCVLCCIVCVVVVVVVVCG
jgi:hypothetical protein